MKIQLDTFLIGEKGERTIYSKSFGYVTVCGYKPTFTVTYSTHTYKGFDEMNRGFCGRLTTKRKKVSLADLFVLTSNSLEPFSFDGKQAGFLVIRGEKKGYHRITDGVLQGKVQLVTETNEHLLRKFFQCEENYVRGEGREKKCVVPTDALQEGLERVHWEEEEENQLIDVENIDVLQPKAKVFVNLPEGGEGEVVSLKKFDEAARQAIFKIKLYNGSMVEVNWFGEEKTGCPIQAIVPKKYKLKKETDVLQESLQESTLSPFVRGMTDGFALYWKEVVGAEEYVAELYTWHDGGARGKLYKLETRKINGVFYTTFEKLAEGKYFTRVIANDKAGKRLAVNKAICVRVEGAKPTVMYYGADVY